jgi:hypothetical protein
MDRRLDLPVGLRAIVAALLLPLHLTSCMTWKTRTVPPSTPSHLRLVMAAGPPVEMWQARVVADSVVGFQNSTGATPLSVPRTSVSQLQTRSFSAGKTTGLVVGTMAGAYAIFYGLAMHCAATKPDCD